MRKVIIFIISIIILAIVYSMCLLFYMHKATTDEATGDYDYIVILGAKVKPSGEPSLALRYRLDEAITYLQTYQHVRVIVSGGKGQDEPISEAAMMRQYLIDHDIERDRIFVEDQSLSTAENIRYTKKLLPPQTTGITIVSNDFHVARARFLAKQHGLKSDVLAAPTPPSVAVQLRVREMAALTKTWFVH